MAKVAAPSGADVFLEILTNYGVEYIFSSPGSEWPPLWEALARQAGQGNAGPKYLNFRHEDLASAAAMGYAKATGKLAVCLVHATVGSLHAAMGIRAAYHDKAPILVCAGESVTLGEGEDPWVGAQWGRYLNDYGGPARLMEPVVKSSFGLNHKTVLAGAVHRACRLAMEAPQGPVFLSLPFEYLHQPAALPAPAASSMPVPAQADPQALRKLAKALAGTRKPLIITENIGRTTAAVKNLVRLAETLGAGVVEAQQAGYVNFPRQHALHAGFTANPYLGDADLVLLLDTIGPWFPPTAMHPPKARVVSISDDPLRQRVPYDGIAADDLICGQPETALASLVKLLPPLMTARGKALAAKRTATWQKRNDARRAAWQKGVDGAAKASPIDARWLCHQLDLSMPANAVLVNETIITNWTLTPTMTGLRPGQLVNGLTGGLGLGMGLAAGIKVAAPKRPVVALMGDGTFNYNPVLPMLGFCQEYGLPVMIIIANNGAYRSMKMGTEMLYPQGWARKTDTWHGGPISPAVNYAALAAATDAHGETVDDPALLAGALKRGFAAMRKGQAVVLDVRIGDETEYLAPLLANAWKDLEK